MAIGTEFEKCARLNAYDQVKQFGVAILSEANARSADAAMPGDSIYERYRQKVAGMEGDVDEIAKATFIQYLSKAAHEDQTKILCQGRRRGYYTREETLVDSEGEVQSASDESDLYPLFVEWLVQNGYRSQIVANSRSNGQWGNPDVVGIKIYEGIASVETELVTIECKKVFDNWKHWIFEAVSHTRFSDRSYFAFAFPEDEIDKKSEELVKYAEYFGVGVLVLEVSSEAYENFKAGDSVGVSGDNIRVLVHARRNRPLVGDKIDFLKGLGVSSIRQLCDFGQYSED